MVDSGLVIGIDGGGTKTTAWLSAQAECANTPLGQGHAGPSNPNAVGYETACANLNAAVEQAFANAGRARETVSAACIAMAGVDRPDEKSRLQAWAQECQLARQVLVVNDALPLLAAGTPAGWGIAVIAGTGSFAIAANRAGHTQRTGGWGYLLGDEGSGYAIAIAGLQAVTQAADGRGPATSLTQAFLNRLQLSHPRDLIADIYQQHSDRVFIAALADVVLASATTGDAVAGKIVTTAAHDLAQMVVALVRAFGWNSREFPLALAGGVLLHGTWLQHKFRARLSEVGCEPSQINTVPEPVAGSVMLAQESAATAVKTAQDSEPNANNSH